jgi:hypothetical protein
MKHHILSWFDIYRSRNIIILLLIAFAFIAISLLVGITDNIPMILVLFTGIVIIFYTLLSPWKKTEYYAVLGGISGLLIIFLFLAGINILVKMQLPGGMAEGIAMGSGFVFAAGIVAGIIGALRFIKKRSKP